MHTPILGHALNTMSGFSGEAHFKIQYWDGSDWVEVSNGVDETNGLTRSGFISWDEADSGEKEINGTTLQWLRLQTDHMKAIGEVKGVNLVFSTDRDLIEDNPDVLDYLKEEENSFIGRHQAARKFILQELKVRGVSDIDEWDIADFIAVKQASKSYVLHLIYPYFIFRVVIK